MRSFVQKRWDMNGLSPMRNVCSLVDWTYQKCPSPSIQDTCRLLTKKISDDKNFADTKNLGFDRLSVNFCEIQQDLEKKMCLKFLGAGPLVGNCRRGQWFKRNLWWQQHQNCRFWLVQCRQRRSLICTSPQSPQIRTFVPFKHAWMAVFLKNKNHSTQDSRVVPHRGTN